MARNRQESATGANEPQEGAKTAPETAEELAARQHVGEAETPPEESTFKPERIYIKVEFPDVPGRDEMIQHLAANDALGDEEPLDGETSSKFYWVHLEKGLGTVMQLHLESIGAQPQMILADKSPNLLEIAGGAAEPLPLDVVLMLAEQTRFFKGEPCKRPLLEKVTNSGDRTIGSFDLDEPNILTIEYTPRASQADGANIEIRRLADELRRANAELKAAEEKRDQSQGLILSQVNVEKYLSLTEEAQAIFAKATATNSETECLSACLELEAIAAAREDKEEKNYEEPAESIIQSRAASLCRAIQSVRPVMDELEQDHLSAGDAGKKVARLKAEIKKMTPGTKKEAVVYCFDLSQPRNFWID
jgi:hypothetical protein